MESSAADIQKAVWIAGLIISNFALILGSYVSIRVAIAELKVRTEQNSKDIDRLGAMLGTERAKARKCEET